MKQEGTGVHPEIERLKKRIASLEAARSKWRMAEKALKESEKNYKNLVEKAGICILVDDVEGNLVYANKKFSNLLGYKLDEQTDKPIGSFIHPDDRNRVLDFHRLRMTGKRAPSRYEFRGVCKDGSLLDLEVDVAVLKEDGKIVGSRSYIWDISERKKNEKVAAALHAISKAINETTNPDNLYPEIHKILGQIIDANNFYIALYDKPTDIIRFVYFTDDEDDDWEIQNASQSGSLTAAVILKGRPLLLDEAQLNKKFKTPQKEWGTQPKIWLGIPLKLRGEILGVMAAQSYTNPSIYTQSDVEVMESVSEAIDLAIHRKRAEEEKQKLEETLLQVQKMEAIGTLAGGIAHDFNNILGVIIGYSELMLKDLDGQPHQARKLTKIHNAALRAKEMVGQILTFSRKSEEYQRPVYVGTIVREAVQFLTHTLPATIQIDPQIYKQEGMVLADSTQIFQLIINICTNAAHAIPKQEGKIRIEVAEEALPDKLAGQVENRFERYMCLTIADSGAGIPADIIDRIFDPFFTTSSTGEGTGMGLAVVHGVVKAHEGEIMVESKPGEGATFRVYLPVAGAGRTKEAGLKPLKDIVGGSERILFVEDELGLAHIGRLMLQKLGYQVTLRTDGAKALDTLHKDPQPFDLVITDMTLPGKTGLDLAREIRGLNPRPPVIICTGPNEPLAPADIKSGGIDAVVTKPLRVYVIAWAIHRALEKSRIP